MLGGANEDRVSLTNTGGTELKHLFVLDVRKGEAQFVRVDRLAPGEFRTVEPPSGDKSGLRPLVEIANELSHELTGALTAEGLHEREAAAMVKTWRPSWFEEEGIRVIYTLPRTWTDSILPLSLDPAPRELVRVMVGRAEIIKPITQWELLKQIVRYAEGDADGRQQAIANVKALELGRFIQPALQTVLGRQPSQEFSRAAWDLLNAASRHDEVKPIALR